MGKKKKKTVNGLLLVRTFETTTARIAEHAVIFLGADVKVEFGTVAPK